MQLFRDSGRLLAAAGCAGLRWIPQHSLNINLVTAMAHQLQADILAVGRTQPTCGHTYADSMSPGQRRIRSCQGTVSLSNQLFTPDHLRQCKHVACKYAPVTSDRSHCLSVCVLSCCKPPESRHTLMVASNSC